MIWFLKFLKRISHTVIKWSLICSIILLAGYSSFVDKDLRNNGARERRLRKIFEFLHKGAKTAEKAVELLR